MQPNFLTNGMQNASGSVAKRLLRHKFDTGVMRPFIEVHDGKEYDLITVNSGTDREQTIITNAPATLRKDEWKVIDDAIVDAAQTELRAYADLRSLVAAYNVRNGMGKTVLETERASDVTDANVSMDGLHKDTADRMEFDLVNLPLPIHHKGFHFTLRQIEASRESGQPIDTSGATLAGRKVAESIEKMYLGTLDTYTFGGGSIYGLTNFPNRLTASLTAPTSSNHDVTVNEVLGMRSQAYAAKHYGPFMLYSSPGWDEYLDEDYSGSKGDNTLRERLRKIDRIMDVRTLYFLPDTTLLLVQMTPDVVRAVNGMEITTVQWDTEGGMQLNYKVMGIQVPQIRADYNNNTGIVHGSV